MGSGSDVGKPTRDVRISLKAFGFNHRSTLVKEGTPHDVELIDLNHEGARLKLSGPTARATKIRDQFMFNIRLEDIQAETGGIPCEVHWMEGNECGVKFIKMLNRSVSELQTLLGKG